MYYIHLDEYLSIKSLPVTPSLHPHCGTAVNGVEIRLFACSVESLLNLLQVSPGLLVSLAHFAY